MSTPDRFKLILVKVDRAKEHLHLLAREISSYLDTKPYRIGTKQDPASRRLIYFMAGVSPTPHKLSAMLGDTISNLRSTLDHLAYQLVLANSAVEPTHNVYFPIADDHAKYIKKRNTDLKGVSTEVIALVDSIAPYKGGNDLLWKLHKLNNIDKHRFLLTAGSALHSLDLLGALLADHMKQFKNLPEGHAFSGFNPTPIKDLPFIRPQDNLFPLKQGDEIFTDLPDATPNDKLQFRFKVAFGEKDIIYGEPIVETLSSMVNHVDHIVKQFEAHLI